MATATRKHSAAHLWFEHLKAIDRDLARNPFAHPQNVQSWLTRYAERQAHLAAMPPGGEAYVGARA
jgi:hypothetical protein